MVATPSDVTVGTLLSAKRKELAFWVKQANSQACSRVLTSQGTVRVLREKLAAYYELDLTSSTTTTASNRSGTNVKPEHIIVSLITMDLEQRKRQWAYLRQLGADWQEKVADGLPFTLGGCRSNDEQANNSKDDKGSTVWGENEVKVTQEVKEVIGGPSPSPPLARPSTCPPPATDILRACDRDLEVLEWAKDLRAIIAQVESGEVAHIRQLYGPHEGRKTLPGPRSR
jgi:hypothetical protein